MLQGPACAIEGEDRSVCKHVIRCSGGASHNYRFVHTDTGTLTSRKKPCKDGTACESDDPPTASQRGAPCTLVICIPAPDRSDRTFLGKDKNAREDVDETSWRGSVN